MGAIAINVRNKVKNKRYLLDAVRGAPGTNAYARMLPLEACRITSLSVFSFGWDIPRSCALSCETLEKKL